MRRLARAGVGVRTYASMVEKIVARYGDTPHVRAGDYVLVRPAHVMTHDNTSAVLAKFTALQAARIADPRQPVVTLDHNVQDRSAANLAKYAAIEAFARTHGLAFYPAGRGIGHQVMCEEGYAFPGSLVVASDSHSNMYGALGCLGTPVVRTDAAGIWATGRTWWKVPRVTKVVLRGQLRPGATGKDVIIALCGLYNADEVLNHAVEFTGDGVAALSIDDRLTIANMTTEWGAIAGVFPLDQALRDWLAARAASGRASQLTPERVAALDTDAINADADAEYAQELILDLGAVEPYVAGPNSVKKLQRVGALERDRVAIQKAYIVSCVNSRHTDLAAAARVLRGRRVFPTVQLYIAAASNEVETASRETGDWQALLDAGARPLPPGCGPCIGLGAGLLEDGEVGISATNRNFRGRMGSRNADCYLASPEVVAASALRGYICAPSSTLLAAKNLHKQRVTTAVRRTGERATTRIVEGFPACIQGRALYLNADNINTDGIYAGAHTYREDLTPAQQAAVLMENYDPTFVSVLQRGDVVVGGYNFGTGSSREQAVTAFKHAGVAVLIAGSFSETYMRNAINNGFLCVELPELIEALRDAALTQAPTQLLAHRITVDFAKARVTYGESEYAMNAIGPAVQEIIVAGGLESWIKQQLLPQSESA